MFHMLTIGGGYGKTMHDNRLTLELDLGNLRLLFLSLVSSADCTTSSQFKDSALREQCVFRTIWAENTPELS